MFSQEERLALMANDLGWALFHLGVEKVGVDSNDPLVIAEHRTKVLLKTLSEPRERHPDLAEVNHGVS